MVKTDSVENWYARLPKNLQTNAKKDDFFDKHLINPASMIGVFGSTGAGKSNYLLEFLSRKKNSFIEIIIFSGSSVDEPLYDYLKNRIPDIQLIDDVADMPTVEALKSMEYNERLLVFDDAVKLPKKKMIEVEKIFLCARKKGFTVMFLSQKFSACSLFIREQLKYIIVFKITDGDMVAQILRRYKMGYNIKELIAEYRDATREKGQFITIDLNMDEIRRNFIQPLTIRQATY